MPVEDPQETRREAVTRDLEITVPAQQSASNPMAGPVSYPLERRMFYQPRRTGDSSNPTFPGKVIVIVRGHVTDDMIQPWKDLMK